MTAALSLLHTLRAENVALKGEREAFLRVVSAALLLLCDMDNDTYESYEAAELLDELLRQLPTETIAEISAALHRMERAA